MAAGRRSHDLHGAPALPGQHLSRGADIGDDRDCSEAVAIVMLDVDLIVDRLCFMGLDQDLVAEADRASFKPTLEPECAGATSGWRR
jgi:hypothetical protein